MMKVFFFLFSPFSCVWEPEVKRTKELCALLIKSLVFPSFSYSNHSILNKNPGLPPPLVLMHFFFFFFFKSRRVCVARRARSYSDWMTAISNTVRIFLLHFLLLLLLLLIKSWSTILDKFLFIPLSDWLVVRPPPTFERLVKSWLHLSYINEKVLRSLGSCVCIHSRLEIELPVANKSHTSHDDDDDDDDNHPHFVYSHFKYVSKGCAIGSRWDVRYLHNNISRTTPRFPPPVSQLNIKRSLHMHQRREKLSLEIIFKHVHDVHFIYQNFQTSLNLFFFLSRNAINK